MSDVLGGRRGTAIVIAGVMASAFVVPSALANGGGQGQAKHGHGNGAGPAPQAHRPGPKPQPAPKKHHPGPQRGTPAAKGGAAKAPPARKAPPSHRSGAAKQSTSTRSRPASAPGTSRARTAKPSSSGRSSGSSKASSKASKPKSSGAGAKSSTPKKHGHDKVWICHATGSTTNPFVRIRPASPSHPQAHDRHQHDEDIIPAPSGGCPGGQGTSTETPRTDVPGGPGGPGPVTSSAASTSQAAGAPSGTMPPATAVITRPLPARSEQTVLGEAGSTGPGTGDTPGAGADDAAVAGVDAPVTAARAGEDDGLPFTGLASWILGLFGLLALSAGIGLRLATRPGR